MAQNDPRVALFASSKMPDLFPVALAETGMQRIEDWIKFETDLFAYLQDVNRNWLARMQSEAAITSEFATKLAAVRSVPETAVVCQEWTNRRIELLSEDGKRLFADTKKLMEAGARMLSNGCNGRP